MARASAYFIVNQNKSGKNDFKSIRGDLDKLEGIISISMNTVRNSVSVDFDTTEIRKQRLFDKLEKMGYDVSETKYEHHMAL